jgi:ribosomal protein S12 methylthiotransferase
VAANGKRYKIAEGCKKRCAFCIIPLIKGPLKSKTEERIVREVRSLREQGVFEIILIAQDLGDFGRDRGEKGALAKLLRKLLEEPGRFWLRLLYLYPDEIDDELIDIIRSDARICPYLDMPIQHIADPILKAMHRTTSKQEILDTLASLRDKIPSISLRTSLMVGFPGETEAHFEELLDFVSKVELDHIGIFTFSAEKEAFAAKLPNQVPDKVKEARTKRLSEEQMKMLERCQRKKWQGKKVQAIVDGYHPESNLLLIARHQGQCPDIDGVIILNDPSKVKAFGKLYEIEIKDVLGYDLTGEVVVPYPHRKGNPLAILNPL